MALSVKVVAFVNASRHAKIAGTGNDTKNISEIKYSDLPDEVKSSYDAYSQHGWQGTVKGQSLVREENGTMIHLFYPLTIKPEIC